MTDQTDQKRATAASFNEAAAAYLESDAHGRGRDLETLAAWCQDCTCVLDIATGAGHTAGAVADYGVPHVIAADAAPSMVSTAVTAFDNLEGVVADADRLPFQSGSFDGVTCRIAAHHFPDPEAFLAEVARVLEPDGVFAFEDNVSPDDDTLTEFLNRVEGTRDPTHVKAYQTSTWLDWLEDAGFSVEKTKHMKKTLEFEFWVDSQSLTTEEQETVADMFRAAPDDAKEFFDVTITNGEVQSFANLKGLFRAIRRSPFG